MVSVLQLRMELFDAIDGNQQDPILVWLAYEDPEEVGHLLSSLRGIGAFATADLLAPLEFLETDWSDIPFEEREEAARRLLSSAFPDLAKAEQDLVATLPALDSAIQSYSEEHLQELLSALR